MKGLQPCGPKHCQNFKGIRNAALDDWQLEWEPAAAQQAALLGVICWFHSTEHFISVSASK